MTSPVCESDAQMKRFAIANCNPTGNLMLRTRYSVNELWGRSINDIEWYVRPVTRRNPALI